MSHVRNIKNVEVPRPLKLSRSHSNSMKNNNFLVMEELIQLIENLAISLSNGINNSECMIVLSQNLRVHGPQLEMVAKDALDRSFVVFRNASQDERLNIMTRLNLLELIELRAKNWEDNGMNTYYKTKANVVDVPDMTLANEEEILAPQKQEISMMQQQKMILQQQQQQQQNQHQSMIHSIQAFQTLAPGEIIKNSGKFMKPTKIPGKNYCKDEVVIRNADSGKVMGIKGRRVHMIEELSETIISFQRVSPGAKERLVQITGPCEAKINYAKHLIEDTIRRNASPIRNPPPLNSSVSPVSSSISDEGFSGNTGNSVQHHHHHHHHAVLQQNNNPTLLHSLSANDASVGEYKYTVNVGPHVIKITGESCDLVRIAKLVLDDYFSGTEFLAGSAFEVPLTPGGNNIDLEGSVMTPNFLGGQFFNSSANQNDDDIFTSEKAEEIHHTRRNHFSRRDLLERTNTVEEKPAKDQARIVYEQKQLIFFAKSPHSWKLPEEWKEISQRFPSIIRNKDMNDESQRFNADKYLEMLDSAAASGSRTFEHAQDDTDE
ncbi:mxt family protein [Megaselia abdita]